MDALIAKADALGPPRKRKVSGPSSSKAGSSAEGSGNKKSRKPKRAGPSEDPTARTVLAHTQVPKSLRTTEREESRNGKSYGHVGDRRLRAHLAQQSSHAVRAKGLVEDLQDMVVDEGDSGGIVAEDPLERTWRVSQDEIAKAVGGDAASGRREWKLDGGSYRMRYTRNGRYVSSLSLINKRWLIFWTFAGTSRLLERKVISPPLTGKQARFIRNSSYRKSVETSRTCIFFVFWQLLTQ